MKDEEEKKKEELISQLGQLRQRIAELEALEADRKRVEEAVRGLPGSERPIDYEAQPNGFCHRTKRLGIYRELEATAYGKQNQKDGD